MPSGMTHIFTVVTRMHAHWICRAVLTHCCYVFSTVCVYVCLFVCVSMQGVGVGGCLQIVLGPVDPSQSEWSCLSLSALDSRGTLIRPDSQPQEMMGRETAHSNHVTHVCRNGRAGRRVRGGGVGWYGKTGRQRGDVFSQQQRQKPQPRLAPQ